MKKIVKKIPAKLNLTLDVFGVKKGFHQLESLVTSVDIFNKITVSKRNDGKITITSKGNKIDCLPHESNAFKAASLFMQKISTTGADITVERNIPVGGGLGCSSADIAGVLLALKELYEVSVDVTKLAGELGSDAPYMTKGGFAVISGRGERVKEVNSEKEYFVLFITEQKPLLAKDCFKKFDAIRRSRTPMSAQAERALLVDDNELFFKMIKNDLQTPAQELMPEVAFNIQCLKKAGADAVTVAGSGPTVFGIFEKESNRNKAYNKLKPLFEKNLIKAKTIPLNKDPRVEQENK